MVKATDEGAKTRIRTAHGKTEEFAIQVGVHQGSALSPFLFIVVMDTLVNEIKSEIPWELIFADDIALMAETAEELQEKVWKWQGALEKGGLKMNARKSEVLVTERGGRTEAEIQDAHGTKLEQRARFKYVGSVIAAEGEVMKGVI